jgi:hypothetical protein
MLQSTVQGAPVFASELVQLMSVDEPPPPAPVVAVPAPPPPAPVVAPPAPVVAEEDVPAAPVLDDSVPPEPVAAEVPDEVPDEVPLVPVITLMVPVPGSVLLEQPEGTQR